MRRRCSPRACASCRGVTSVRGRGLMVAAEVEADAPALVRRALVEQRLDRSTRPGPGTLRFLPPLVVSDAEIADALGRLRALLA